MSAESNIPTPKRCSACGTVLTQAGMCPRCLFGDVLAVLDGPVSPVPPPSHAQPGGIKRVGEFELIEELGRGGMGVVWKARQRRLNRVVALKLVRGGCLPGESAAKRFRREAEAAAQLKHPNIVMIHEVGEVDEQLYLSMDLVEGGSLADWLKRVAFSSRDAAALVAKVARGVHHAHEHRILHRDLKPGNILLNATGEPQVCDFGLARLGEAESSLTMSGELLGTPAYLSPEQATGRMKDLTPASDTYSLGAILYELLCGHPPFSAENIPALLRKVAEDDPMRPISHYSGNRVPFDLSTICLKCLEKEPGARYPTALALAEDLERWLRGEPIVARPVAPVERVWKWVRRKPVLAALWLGVTALTLIIAVITSVMSFRLQRERAAVAAMAEDSRHRVARQLSESAQRYLSAGDNLRALPALAAAIETGTGEASLDEADRIRFGMALRCSPALVHTWLGGIPLTRAEATGDGRRLLIATEKSAEVWDIDARKRVGGPLELEAVISNCQFDSSAGKWLLVESQGRLIVWEPDSGARRELGTGQIYTPPDGFPQRGANFVSFQGREAAVRSLADGRQLGSTLLHEGEVEWAVLLPETDRALSCDTNGSIHLWDTSTGAAVVPPVRLVKPGQRISLDAYHHVQKRAAMHRDRECWTFDCNHGTVVGHLRKAENSPQTLGWDESDEWHFIARNNDGVTLRSLSDGSIRWPWLHHGLGFRGSFAPAAGLVATQSWNGSTRVWQISNGRPTSPFVWQTGTPGSCILDPRGRWLLTRGDEPAARLWQLRESDGATMLSRYAENPVNAWFAGTPERLVIAEEDGWVRAWTAEPPHQKTAEARHPEGAVTRAMICGDRSRFLTGGHAGVQVWDAATWKPAGALHPVTAGFADAALDHRGTRLAVVTPGGEVTVRDAAGGEAKSSFQAGARKVAFNSDGTLLLAMSEKGGQTWNPSTGQPVSPLVEQAGGHTRAKFSPDGKSVLQWSARQSGRQSRAIIWDAPTGKVKTQLPPHWIGVGDAEWSPDGRLVATGGADLTLLLSDAETGAQMVAPIKQAQKVAALGFSGDGLLLWSLTEKEITIWCTLTGEQVSPRLRQPTERPLIAMAHGTGRDLAVVGARAAPRIWRLNPDPRNPDELQSIAHALSAHALVGGTSALRPLTLVEMRSAWENARAALGAW